MQSVVIGEVETLTIPAGADGLTITHEWGKSVTVSISGVNYGWVADSVGTYKLVWLDGDQILSTEFRNVYLPLISFADFSDENQEIVTETGITATEFNKAERIVRSVIQNYTGQIFGPYINQSLEVQGDGGDSLVLPIKVIKLSGVYNNYGDDISDLIELSPSPTPTIIQRHRRMAPAGSFYDVKRDVSYGETNLFNADYIFTVEGDFGWEYVPVEVSDAASLLLLDGMGGSDFAEARRQGVFEAQIGDFKFRLNADQWGTTGNTQADNILAGHVNFGIGLV